MIDTNSPGTGKLSDQLDSLLEENIDSAKKRETETFDKLSENKGADIVIFGAGELGVRTLEGLQKIGIEVLCFSDNNKKLWGSVIEGIEILSPADAANKFPDASFVLTIYSAKIGHPIKEIQEQLGVLGAKKVFSFVYLYWKYPEIFLPYWRCDLPHKTLEQFELVSAAFSLWSDDISRQEYFGQVYWRLKGDDQYFVSPVKDEQYFPEDIFALEKDEVFVDIGAFDGDTFKIFAEKSDGFFEHYYGYEPDQFGFKKLEKYISSIPAQVKNKTTFEPIGIGSHNEKINIETPGVYFKVLFPEETAAYISEGNSNYKLVESKSLDSIDFKHKPTFIKMDVEGFEPQVIFGAKKLIKDCAPVLAIAIYHQYDHIWRLPLAINAISDKYSFFLRPHFHAGWELVLYAVPKERVRKIK